MLAAASLNLSGSHQLPQASPQAAPLSRLPTLPYRYFWVSLPHFRSTSYSHLPLAFNTVFFILFQEKSVYFSCDNLESTYSRDPKVYLLSITTPQFFFSQNKSYHRFLYA